MTVKTFPWVCLSLIVLLTPPLLADPRTTENTALLRWLEEHSMLFQAERATTNVSGNKSQWQHAFARPQPRQAVQHASVWLLDYPGSVIPGPDKSVLATWGEPALWDTLQDIGIQLLHTGPVNRAGGVEGMTFTPTLDGWFDRISLELDPALGTEKEYARMVEAARNRQARIAGDLVPLHTGMGADFFLALRAYKQYPGMYVLVEIDSQDWKLLPEVKNPWQVSHVSRETARTLTRKGYLPGLINSNDAAKQARNWSGWSATAEIAGADGKKRRWVYLHFFKQSQPTLNWLDPSFAAQRAVFGDATRLLSQRGNKILRLDAVPFLGIEHQPGTTNTFHFKHPLSVNATNELSFYIRKMGGWSFQELNIPLKEFRTFTEHGPDLSYDFFTRAQCMHAVLTEDAAPLRLAFRWLLEAKVQPLTLVHDLQNHDEITYQLTELQGRKDEIISLGKAKMRGDELREHMLQQMRAKVSGEAASYNYLYRPEKDGLVTTFAGFLAPALGVRDPYRASAEEIALIRRGHLLLAAANALQPGVFSLSSWDLVGALPVPLEGVEEWVADGDYRWVNRGGVDLLGANPARQKSAFGIPRAKSLYGSLPESTLR